MKRIIDHCQQALQASGIREQIKKGAFPNPPPRVSGQREKDDIDSSTSFGIPEQRCLKDRRVLEASQRRIAYSDYET